MTRFSKQDWIELGLTELAKRPTIGQGASIGASLTLEHLCAAAKKTRGSFYHHFADHDAFVREMLEFWEERDTKQIIAQTNAAGDHQPTKLNGLASQLDHRLETHIRQLAQNNQVARKIVARVDQIRIDFMTALYLREDLFRRREARELARIEYALYVGAQTLWPTASARELEQIGTQFIKLVRQPGAPQ